MLANLIENALRFSPADAHVVVRITATRKEAIVRVVDQGPASPEGELERVFEPFYRRDGDASSGAGLGLAIARGFAGGERRPRLGRVAAGPGCDVRARAARRRGAGGAAQRERPARPRRRRRAADPARAPRDAARRRLHGRRGGDGRRGAHRGRGASARGGDPRPRPPGRERHGRLPRAALVERRAGDRALRGGRGAPEDRRARRRRRRLRHEAVQRRRAARAAARGAAPGGAPTQEPVLEVGATSASTCPSARSPCAASA